MLIGKVQKNAQEEIRVYLQEYKGVDLIDLRVFWQNAEDEMVRAKKGISIPLYCVEDVLKILQKALKELKQREKERDEDAQYNNFDLVKLIKQL